MKLKGEKAMMRQYKNLTFKSLIKSKIFLLFVLVALGIFVGAIAINSTKQKFDITLSLPTFKDKGTHIEISLTLSANQNIDITQIQHITLINNKPLSAYQAKLNKLSPLASISRSMRQKAKKHFSFSFS